MVFGSIGQSNNPVLLAARLAALWHKGQVRKYTHGDYVYHPGRVAARLSWHPEASELLICAAWLHDVIEDCGKKQSDIFCATLDGMFFELLLGESIAQLVQELTNRSKQFPKLLRKERKAMDREFLRTASHEAKLIKLVDRADNLWEMGDASESEQDFLKKYCDESEALLECLRGTDETLEQEYVARLTASRAHS